MPLKVIRGNLCLQQTSAILHPICDSCEYISRELLMATNESYHDALAKAREVESYISGSYGIGSEHIIHIKLAEITGLTAISVVKASYQRALLIAAEQGFESIALPLIPIDGDDGKYFGSLTAAREVAEQCLKTSEITINIVVPPFADLTENTGKYDELDRHINETHSEVRRLKRGVLNAEGLSDLSERLMDFTIFSAAGHAEQQDHLDLYRVDKREITGDINLSEMLKMLDESFSEMLLRKIDESGMSDSECYQKANIDRRLFSKIKSDRLYRPSKPTVIAFAIALKLPTAEAEDLLQKAGYAFSRTNKFDIIVKHYIERGAYNIHEINQTLFYYDQSLLGN